MPKPAATFGYKLLRMNTDDGTVEIDGEEPIYGMRVVHTAGKLHGEPEFYVVRVPGHSYHSLDRSAYAHAEFVIYQADYGEQPRDGDQRREDAPWVRVRQFMSFPVMAGTKLQR